jgi:hypothetical protein
MTMRFQPEKVLAEARQANTADLLDRVTVYRDALEADAVEIIEAELARRGLGPEEIEQHRRGLRHRVLRRNDGMVARCSFCPRAAVESAVDWHKLWGLVPLFKRTFYYCDDHWQRGGGVGG